MDKQIPYRVEQWPLVWSRAFHSDVVSFRDQAFDSEKSKNKIVIPTGWSLKNSQVLLYCRNLEHII